MDDKDTLDILEQEMIDLRINVKNVLIEITEELRRIQPDIEKITELINEI